MSTSSPIESITGLWRFTRGPSSSAHSRSLPGHLLHLVRSGAYRLRTNQREYDIRAGDVIYYHETEDVEWLGNATAVVFDSVGFMSSSFEPLGAEMRVFRSDAQMRRAFDGLHSANLMPEGFARRCAIYGALSMLLSRIELMRAGHAVQARPRSAWSEAERIIRERKWFRPTLDQLAEALSLGRASVVRAARKATGQSPMQRIRDIRIEEAKGLLKYSILSISQVAAYLGYGRVHEFSREFRKHTGAAPSSLRR
jgi:AraC-like DNA-binding protein